MISDQARLDFEVVRRLMDAQEHCDWAALEEIFTDDAVFELPFINEKLSGKAEIIARWRPSLERMDGVHFYALELRPMAEAGWYVGTFRNTCTVRTTGRPYDQLYIGEFHVVGGKVAYFSEYFDTVRLGIALRKIEKIA